MISFIIFLGWLGGMGVGDAGCLNRLMKHQKKITFLCNFNKYKLFLKALKYHVLKISLD
jgi:hypothetical protein